MNEDELYEGYEDEHVSEIEGITDKVTDLSYTNLQYPAIIFKEGFKLPKHQVAVISNMVKSAMGNASKDISLYFQNEGDLYRVGMLTGQQIMHLLNIVPRDQIDAFYDDGSKLNGDKIYCLCSFF